MKNFIGLAIFGLIAAAVGAAATVYALKKRDEMDAYEDYDDDFYDDCDCNCEECAGCEDISDVEEETYEGADVEKDLDSVDEGTSDLEKMDGTADF